MRPLKPSDVKNCSFQIRRAILIKSNLQNYRFDPKVTESDWRHPSVYQSPTDFLDPHFVRESKEIGSTLCFLASLFWAQAGRTRSCARQMDSGRRS